MKVLFIGGTGNISAACSRLAVEQGIDLYLLNRGITKNAVKGATVIAGDLNHPAEVARTLKNRTWDAVVNWVGYTARDVARDYELFRDATKQYLFISSASAYQKPSTHPVITESTPLSNPYWQYSRDKIACEDYLTAKHRETGFPVTIVRPSLTYQTIIPGAIGGSRDFTVPDRMLKGKPVIIHGDGTSLWTVTHSEDFAKGFVGLLGHQQALGHAFHITSDEILTWNQIYEALADALGVKGNFIHIPSDFICRFDPEQEGRLLGDKAGSVIFDNTKIKRFVPGYQAVIPFKEGIQRTIQWFLEDPSRRTVNQANNQLIDGVIAAYEEGLNAIAAKRLECLSLKAEN